MNPINLVCTDTTRFIMPMLFSNSNHTEVLKKDFIDSYSFDYYEPGYDNTIIIVKDNDELPDADYSPINIYKRQNQWCFVYVIPNKYRKDYDYILTGRYNLIGKNYYSKLLNFWDEDELLPYIKYNPIREMYRVTE